ncbi:hypothetical protein FOL47_011307, partial [Perkinsus chesapeaki]
KSQLAERSPDDAVTLVGKDGAAAEAPISGKPHLSADGTQVIMPSGWKKSLATLVTKDWLVGDVEGRDCIIVDDIIDSAKRMSRTVKDLRQHGARRIYMYATHGVLSPAAMKRINQRGVTEVVITNSLPFPEHARKCEKIRVLSLGQVLAEVMLRIYEEKSVSQMFWENQKKMGSKRPTVAAIPYERRGHSSKISTKTISREAVRDILRVGHLGLGKSSAIELGKVLRRKGIRFPEGGLKRVMEEKWDIFGPIFACENLLLEQERNSEPCSTPFGLCTDINRLLNIVTEGQADRIARLKFQFDGGQQFLKLSVNIVSMEGNCNYVPSPNSVKKNFLVGMGQAELFACGISKQVACDLKVSAMMVGIQSAASKFPCPFCLFVNGTKCDGKPATGRNWALHAEDLEEHRHNVVGKPVLCWDKSPMEVLSLSPLHLLLGLTNKVYSLARPSEQSPSIYQRHCTALKSNAIRRSAYFNGGLEGNACSRSLDSVSEGKIPFEAKPKSLVEVMKTVKLVKDTCLGIELRDDWKSAIEKFRTSWTTAGLRWSLKAHILSDHTIEYLADYERLPGAGLGLSSEQSGEALHSRVQRLWDLRFKVARDNSTFGSRLVDCMVTYNWNIDWDAAGRVDVDARTSADEESETSDSGESCRADTPESDAQN